MVEREAAYGERREEMVEQLRRYGILSSRVLEAFRKVERHRFFAPADRAFAYEDAAFPIGFGQTISQPYTVAYMTSLLDERCPSGRILEIGTGSGYQAAILDSMGYCVYSVERVPGLFNRAEGVFRELGLDIAQRLGDGSLGWKEHAPYDGIIVTAAAPEPPPSLLDQLADNGVLVIPVGGSDGQRMTVFTRKGDRFEREVFLAFSFVPLIGREGWWEE